MIGNNRDTTYSENCTSLVYIHTVYSLLHNIIHRKLHLSIIIAFFYTYHNASGLICILYNFVMVSTITTDALEDVQAFLHVHINLYQLVNMAYSSDIHTSVAWAAKSSFTWLMRDCNCLDSASTYSWFAAARVERAFSVVLPTFCTSSTLSSWFVVRSVSTAFLNCSSLVCSNCAWNTQYVYAHVSSQSWCVI